MPATGSGWPIGYTADAGMLCVTCGIDRFGSDPENGGHVPEDATDREGNQVGAVFPGSEVDCPGYGCEECGEIIPETLIHRGECGHLPGDPPYTADAFNDPRRTLAPYVPPAHRPTPSGYMPRGRELAHALFLVDYQDGNGTYGPDGEYREIRACNTCTFERVDRWPSGWARGQYTGERCPVQGRNVRPRRGYPPRVVVSALAFGAMRGERTARFRALVTWSRLRGYQGAGS